MHGAPVKRAPRLPSTPCPRRIGCAAHVKSLIVLVTAGFGFYAGAFGG